MTTPLVLSQAFDGLARALGASLTEDARTRFRALGVDYAGDLLPAYPLEIWVQAMDLGSQVLTPGADAEARFFALGRRMLDGYGDTVVGKALLGVMRVIGPRKVLDRMARNLRTANNYAESKVEPLPAGRTRVWSSRVVHPAFYRGMLSRGLEVAGGRDVRIEVLAQDDAGASFAVQWS